MVGHNFPSKDLVSFNFMAVVTIHSDFGIQENKSVTVSIVYPPIFHEVMGLDVDYFWFIDYMEALDCVCHKKLENS